MGPPAGPDEMLRLMENPMFLSQMNEAMNNPAVIQMMQENPMIRDNPMAREMLQNPEFRRMLLDPNVIRAQLEMQRRFGGGNTSAFPAPGVTNTTPQQPNQQNNTTGEGNTTTAPGTQGLNPQANPFGGLGYGFPNLGQGGGANPFAALFGAPSGGFGAGAGTSPLTPQTPATSPPHTASAGQATPAQDAPSTPQGQAHGSNTAQPNPLASLLDQWANNLGQQQGEGAGAGAGTGAGGVANPFASLFNPFAMPQQPSAPPDNRPPEERYAEQLRQLNDMGFYDFDRNVAALSRSGGSVQGAIESLLNNP
jgi:ubiquilin